MDYGSWQVQNLQGGLATWRPGDPRVRMTSHNRLLDDSLLLEEASLFVLVWPSAEWKVICLLKFYLFKC